MPISIGLMVLEVGISTMIWTIVSFWVVRGIGDLDRIYIHKNKAGAIEWTISFPSCACLVLLFCFNILLLALIFSVLARISFLTTSQPLSCRALSMSTCTFRVSRVPCA